MADKVTIGGIVKTSIVTAFTIAAALIWKDLFTAAIELFYPQDVLFYQFVGALIATVFVIAAIFVTLRTEQEAETIVNSIKNMSKTRRKEILRQIRKEKEKQREKEKKKEKQKPKKNKKVKKQAFS